MAYLRVALATPLRRFFDYKAPPQAIENPQPGLRVSVPFGPRQLVGVVVDIVDTTEVPANKLRSAIEWLDTEPPQPSYMQALALWAADYYQHPPGDALLHSLPVALRKGQPAEKKRPLRWFTSTVDASEQISKRALKQWQVYEIIQAHPQGISSGELKLQLDPGASLKQLADKGLIEQRPIEPSHKQQLGQQPLTLNQEQASALEAINSSDGYQCFLLDGITGAGKTEVYLQAIEKVLAEGKQALVLVPEIGLTPQTVARFEARFHYPIVSLHSNLTDAQRCQAWLEARDGDAAIIIGTRSAIFTPLANPGLIIVDEEHDSSFKQQDGFRYSARDLAVVRGHGEDVPVVLGSATPSLESLYNSQRGRFIPLLLRHRAGGAVAPSMQLLDIRREPLEAGFSPQLLNQIEQHLNAGTQVLVFINRRGFAPSLHCHSCGWIAGCKRCDAKFTVHYQPAHLHCHHCDAQRPIPRHCQECGSTELLAKGTGTERAEQALQRHFPDTPIWRVDRDSTSRKHAMQEILDQVHQGESGILVGTQMLAKGHHFPKVTLVAILDADGGLFSSDFRGMERTAQLIIQVAGRAGRADLPGSVVIQTHQPDHPLLVSLCNEGYQAFAQQELALRASSGLAPMMHLAVIRAEATASGRAEAFLQLAREQHRHTEGVVISGPFPAPMEKRAGVFRAQLVLSCPSRPRLQDNLSRLCLELEQHPLANKVRWNLDVDPYDMF